MKKLILVLTLLFSQFSYSQTTWLLMQQNQNNKNKEAALQQSPVLIPTNASWLVLKENPELRLQDKGMILTCSKGWKLFSQKCSGEEKKYTIESYMESLYGKVKILGITPHFDQEGKFQFLVVYFIN